MFLQRTSVSSFISLSTFKFLLQVQINSVYSCTSKKTYFIMSNDSGPKTGCLAFKHTRLSITWQIFGSEIAFVIFWKLLRNNCFNSTWKYSAFFKVRVISRKIGLEHDTCELFCCLTRDCNYRDEEFCDLSKAPKSRLYGTGLYIVFKALGGFWSFLKLYIYIQIETVMYAIISHKKRRAKYQTQMLLRITKTAIQVKRSNYK